MKRVYIAATLSQQSLQTSINLLHLSCRAKASRYDRLVGDDYAEIFGLIQHTYSLNNIFREHQLPRPVNPSDKLINRSISVEKHGFLFAPEISLSDNPFHHVCLDLRITLSGPHVPNILCRSVGIDAASFYGGPDNIFLQVLRCGFANEVHDPRLADEDSCVYQIVVVKIAGLVLFQYVYDHVRSVYHYYIAITRVTIWVYNQCTQSRMVNMKASQSTNMQIQYKISVDEKKAITELILEFHERSGGPERFIFLQILNINTILSSISKLFGDVSRKMPGYEDDFRNVVVFQKLNLMFKNRPPRHGKQ